MKQETKQVDVKAIQSRVEKATPGPWVVDKKVYDYSMHYAIETRDKLPQHPHSTRLVAFFAGSLGEIVPCRRTKEDYRNDPEVEADAQFIAHARTDIPDLLSALSDAEGIVREMHLQLDNLFAMVEGECPRLLDDHHSWGEIKELLARPEVQSILSRGGKQ